MNVLALDFSSDRREVALVRTEVESAAAAPVVLASRRATLAEKVAALDLVDQTLVAAGLVREAVDCLAVGLGPGSYTGIRSAIALAQGWQLARPVRTVGIGSIDAIAARFARDRQGPFWMVLDAQRGEFYLAGGQAAAGGWTWEEPLRLATAAEVQTRVEAGGVLVGPEVTRWFPGGVVLYPEAEWVGRLASSHGHSVPAECLEPIYLRPTTFVKAPAPIQVPEA